MKSDLERGFSLVSVMVSAAIAALVLAAMVSMSNMGARSQRTLASFNEQTSIKNELLQTFNNMDACKLALAGVSIAGLGAEVAIKEPNGSGFLARKGDTRNGVSFDSVKFSNRNDIDLTDVNNQKHLATLTIRFDRKGQTYSAQFKEESLKVYVITDASKSIKSCYGELSPASVCADMGGIYNPAGNPKCDLKKTVCETDLGGTIDGTGKCVLPPQPADIQLSPIAYMTFTLASGATGSSMSATATCPAGYRVISCLGCVGAGCKPDVAFFDTNANRFEPANSPSDNYYWWIGFFVFMNTTSQSCTGSKRVGTTGSSTTPSSFYSSPDIVNTYGFQAVCIK
jgi:hypothetical protein